MTGADERPRVAILWQRLPGYTHAEFAALARARRRRPGRSIRRPRRDAPFADDATTAGLDAHAWSGAPDEDRLEAALAAREPHALLVSSWHITAYRRVARRRRGQTLRVLCMDNQWWATPKQWLGVASSPVLIRPTYDAAFLPGDRSADFARRLGFSDARIIQGINTCDHPRFDAVAGARGAALPERAFTFVGRLVGDKGIDVLAEGYRRYCRIAEDPWPLAVAGAGPQALSLAGLPGVRMSGFVQPDEMPALLARSGCLVLPSRFEPWGLVIHEATAAGLPVVCTSVCGAASRLVLDGYNGVVIPPGDPDALARALLRIAGSSDTDRLAMTGASRSLARQFTPDRWARHLLARVQEMREQLGLAAAPTPARTTI